MTAHSLETRFVDVGGQQVRIAIGGAPHATRTMLLFNGIGASIETMAPFMAEFRRTRVLAFDAPGVGQTPAPLLPYRLRDVARLAARLLDRLGIDRVDVFGVSWGGAAAQEFAIAHPRRCCTLTLAATTAGLIMVPSRPGVLLKMLSPRRYMAPACLTRGAGDLYGGVLRVEREMLEAHAEVLRGPSRRGYIYQLLAIAGWTSWPRLHKVKAPALVMVGEDDPIVPPCNGRIIVAGLRRATMQTINCGHLFVLTQPRETARRTESFLHGRHPPQVAGARHLIDSTTPS